eukprot:scaffold384175_cov28-Prasinocladus_malaysianus.AAC.1
MCLAAYVISFKQHRNKENSALPSRNFVMLQGPVTHEPNVPSSQGGQRACVGVQIGQARVIEAPPVLGKL